MGPHRSGWKIEIEELGLGIWKDLGSTGDKHSGGYTTKQCGLGCPIRLTPTGTNWPWSLVSLPLDAVVPDVSVGAN